MLSVLARPPQVRCPRPAGGDLRGRDQRAVQAQVRPVGGLAAFQDFGKRGRLLGDHVDRFVQVAVGGRDADPGVQGQDPQLGRVLEPAQDQQRLCAGGRGALDRTGTWPAAVRCEPPRHDLQGGFGHVETGTIGDQRGVLAGEQGVLADSRSFRPGPRVLTATHREPAGHGPAGRPPAFNLSSKTHHRAEERGEKTSLGCGVVARSGAVPPGRRRTCRRRWPGLRSRRCRPCSRRRRWHR